MSAPTPYTSRGRRRSDHRRLLQGRPPKPSPRLLRAIDRNNHPKDLDRLRQLNRLRLCSGDERSFRARRVDAVRQMLRSSGTLPYLTERLRGHRGSRCDYPPEAVLVAMVLSVWCCKLMSRARVMWTLAELPARVRYELGLYDPETYCPPSYRSVWAQVKRLERSLASGWIAADGTVCDFRWLKVHLLRASIPPSRLARMKACALDGAAWESRAKIHWLAKKEVCAEEDRAAAFWKGIAEGDEEVVDPIITEVIETKSSRRSRAGTRADAGRVIYTADSHARMGHRTTTSTQPTEWFVGYEAHVVCAVPEFVWNRNLANAGRDYERAPLYILGIDLTPAGWHRGDAGFRAIEVALELAPTIVDVVCDRAYTMARAETFRRKLRELGINVTMDFPAYLKQKCVPVAKVRTKGKGKGKGAIGKGKGAIGKGNGDGQDKGKIDTLFENCGTFFHAALPGHLRTIDGDPRKSDEAKAAYDERARTYGWSQQDTSRRGKMLLRCPFHAGRAKNPTLNPSTSRLSHEVPYVDAPSDLECCCQSNSGCITMYDDELDNYQIVPYGTSAWVKSYGRRNLVESVIKMLRNSEGLTRSAVHAFGIDSHEMAAICMAVAHNLELNERVADGRPFEDADTDGEADAAARDEGTGPAPQAADAQGVAKQPDEAATADESPAHGGTSPPNNG